MKHKLSLKTHSQEPNQDIKYSSVSYDNITIYMYILLFHGTMAKKINVLFLETSLYVLGSVGRKIFLWIFFLYRKSKNIIQNILNIEEKFSHVPKILRVGPPKKSMTEMSPYSFGNFRNLSLYNCFMPI